MFDMPTRFKRPLTPAVSRARKLKRSVSCRASAPVRCWARDWFSLCSGYSVAGPPPSTLGETLPYLARPALPTWGGPYATTNTVGANAHPTPSGAVSCALLTPRRRVTRAGSPPAPTSEMVGASAARCRSGRCSGSATRSGRARRRAKRLPNARPCSA